MTSTEILITILGMCLVTYIPRLLPVIFIGKIHINEKIEKFLKLIPYTAMAALIFPGILTVDENKIYIGLIGGVVAAILAYKKFSVMICVIAAIIVNLLFYLFI